jgi:ATP-dependent exoDNAse (exonuclease V) alpha subunit
MLLNLSNHPFNSWSEKQSQVALETYGEVVDLQFPQVGPYADELDIEKLTFIYVNKVVKMKPDAVHIMGEMTFTFQMVQKLLSLGIPCIASTTNRKAVIEDGKKISVFEFAKFRSYTLEVSLPKKQESILATHFIAPSTDVEQIFEKEELESLNKELILEEITQEEGFTLSKQQQDAYHKMIEFVESNEHNVFILKGYAGTGKTTLLKFVMQALKKNKKRTCLMATTGRAAAILKEKTNTQAMTVHSLVYDFKGLRDQDNAMINDTGQFYLFFDISKNNPEDDNYDLFIVDEASMIASTKSDEISVAKFGSGNLLEDFLKKAAGKKIIFVGDPCQLPPVSKESFSAALDAYFLEKKYQMKVREVELTEIQRQAENSGVLALATPLREEIIHSQKVDDYPTIQWRKDLPDLHLVPDTKTLYDQYVEKILIQKNAAKVLAFSNKDAFLANQEIRKKLFGEHLELRKGDLLMVAQNCYLTGLNNGEEVEVLEIGKRIRQGENLFLQVKLKSLNDNQIYETLIFEKMLSDALSNIDSADFKSLMRDFILRMENLKIKRNSTEFYKNMYKDRYLNALRVKYGYAITLHKAQGGEWGEVFINLSKSIYVLKHQNKSKDIIRWYYTAITRAGKKLHILNGNWIKKEL